MTNAISSEQDIEALVYADKGMMHALHVAGQLNLPDWWIGAGFLRNKVWDVMTGVESIVESDIDLVYFNKDDASAEADWAYDEQLRSADPGNNWEVRNQARMHYVNGFAPFTSTKDGIAHWTETATAVAVRLEGKKLRFLYCYGSDDLLNMIARPTPYLKGEKLKIFYERMEKKKWRERWPLLKIEDN